MEIYFICNNLFENNLTYYDKENIEKKKMTRPLSVEGEELAKTISLLDSLKKVTLIYSSMYSSSLATAKYLAERNNKNIIVDENLNDCKVGILGNRQLKMIKIMQNHDFNIKLKDGESLEEVKERMSDILNKIIYVNGNKSVAVFTHKRAVLGLLLKYGKVGYNLDDDLVVEFNEKVVYDESDKDVDIIKFIIDDNKKVIDIDVIDL